MAMSADLITIEVAYALPNKQRIIELMVEPNTQVLDAVKQSGICRIFKDIDLDTAKFGIWNRTAKPTAELEEGDRIEIYRPLIADPKEVRKRRAEKAKEEGRADKVTGGRPKSTSQS